MLYSNIILPKFKLCPLQNRWFCSFKYNKISMTKDIFIFYLTLIFFPFQGKPAKERIMLSVINKTKKQCKNNIQYIIYYNLSSKFINKARNYKNTWYENVDISTRIRGGMVGLFNLALI